MKNFNHNGFTLIEVLIAVFVLALGVLGVAGVQMTAMRTTQQSNIQTSALQLASEMADKMRSNASQMKLSDAENPFLSVDYQAASDPEAPSKTCYANSCNAEDLAKFDIYEWETRIKAALPGGRVKICRDTESWDSATSALTWTCTPSASASDGGSMVIKIGWQGKNPDGTLIKEEGQNTFPPSVVMTVEPYTS